MFRTNHTTGRVARSRLRTRALATVFAATTVAAAGGCGDTPFQVIEELEFAASLGIDLDSMELLPSGVYIRDITVGPGLTVFPDSEVRIAFVGWTSDGNSFGDGEFDFGLGTGAVIPGFELGIIGMNQGGERRIIVPPHLGYGEENQTGIPAGSVLIFDVEAIEVYGEESPAAADD
jgi:hypothetical protein